MQHHTAEQLDRGPAAGRWVYTGGNHRTGRYVQCCAEPWTEIMRLPAAERDASPQWEQVGHATREEAYAHMRVVLLGRLYLDGETRDWSGCRAPLAGGTCDAPTKRTAGIPPTHFLAHLCDEHRTREVVEAMWDGPGDTFGSF